VKFAKPLSVENSGAHFAFSPFVLTLAFPVKSPEGAKALADELPSLMFQLPVVYMLLGRYLTPAWPS
jgi:hypothetical protein